MVKEQWWSKRMGEPVSEPVLEVLDLYKIYRNQYQPAMIGPGVRGVSLHVYQGEVVGLIGESGCGKTTLGRCVARLINPDSGTIRVNGRNFSAMRGEELRKNRQHVQVVFQRPETCLNPRMSVYQFIREAFSNFNTCEKGREREKLLELIRMVGLKEEAIDFYPHQLSGGEKQRVAIMRALACDPSVIVLDEPTSALDVSVPGHGDVLRCHHRRGSYRPSLWDTAAPLYASIACRGTSSQAAQ
jgi:ABC-type glutathione transport system ATPase component